MPSKEWIVIAVLTATAGGCSDQRERDADAGAVKREARELAEALESYSAEHRDQAVEAAGQALADLDRELEDLRGRMADRWDQMDESARREAEKRLEDLKDEQAELAQRFHAMRDASGDAWARMREGFADAYGELREAWEDAEALLSD